MISLKRELDYDASISSSKANHVRIEELAIDSCVTKKQFNPIICSLLLTHGHGDHWNNVIIKHCLNNDIPVYTHSKMKRLADAKTSHVRKLDKEYRNQINYIDFGGEFVVEGLFNTYHIKVHKLHHDVPTCGYEITILYPEGDILRVFYATDTGTLEHLNIPYCDYYFLETNYDSNTLRVLRSGVKQGQYDRFKRSELIHMDVFETYEWFRQYQNNPYTNKLVQLHKSAAAYRIDKEEISMKNVKLVEVTVEENRKVLKFQNEETGLMYIKPIYVKEMIEGSDPKEFVDSPERKERIDAQLTKHLGVDFDGLDFMELGGNYIIFLDEDGNIHWEAPVSYAKLPDEGTKVQGYIHETVMGRYGIRFIIACDKNYKLPKLVDGELPEDVIYVKHNVPFTTWGVEGVEEAKVNRQVKTITTFLESMDAIEEGTKLFPEYDGQTHFFPQFNGMKFTFMVETHNGGSFLKRVNLLPA